jgi:hypothetical protein
MFKGQAMPAPNSASIQSSSVQSQYENFTSGQRWGTFGLNLLVPGAGSIAIMQDWVGAVPQWVLVGGGIALIILDNDINSPGLLMFEANVFYVILRSAFYNKKTYNRKMPKNTASLEPTGFRWAVLPDGNGEVKAYLAYRVEF